MGQRQSGVIGVLLLAIGLLSSHVAGADKRLARDHYKRGMAHFVMERWDEAISEFDAGFTEEPLPEFLYNIAQAHRKAGRAARAISFYKKYLSLMPDNAPDRRQVELEMEAAREELPPSPPVAAPSPVPAPVPEPVRPSPAAPSDAPPSPRITIERVPAPAPAPVVPAPAPAPVAPAPAPVVRTAAPSVPAPVTPSPPLVASIESPPSRTAPVEESPFVETHTAPVETPIAPPSRSHTGGRLQAAGAVLLVVGAGIAAGGGLGFHYASQSAADQIIDERHRVMYDPSLGEAMVRDQTLSIAAYAAGGALAAVGCILLIEGSIVKSRESKSPSLSLVPSFTPRAAGFALSGSF